jgi:hypothetical protein
MPAPRPTLDPYFLLDVPLNATSEEIRAAYRRRAAACHPDIQPPEKKAWALEQMKELNAARDLLLDPARRTQYDTQVRLEMQKAMWRARQETYAPPVEPFLRRRRRRRGYHGWFGIALLVSGLLVLYALPTFFSTSPAALSPSAFALLLTAAKLLVAWAGLMLGPLFVTLLLVVLFQYWKN